MFVHVLRRSSKLIEIRITGRICPRSKKRKRKLNFFESLAESSRITGPRERRRIHGSQACSSRSLGEQIEEECCRSRGFAGPPANEEFQFLDGKSKIANEEFRFWDEIPKIEPPVVSKRDFPKTSTPQLKRINPQTRIERYIPPNLDRKSPIFTIVEERKECIDIPDDTEKYIDITVDDNDELRRSLINRCEEIVLDILEQLCAGNLPRMSYQISTIDELMANLESESSDSVSTDTNSTSRVLVERSSVFDTPKSMGTESIESQNEESVTGPLGQTNLIDFGWKRSRNVFALAMTTIAKVHDLLNNNKTATRRSFFYELKNDEKARMIVTKQRQVDKIVNTVANLLECPPWETGLVPSAKGLAAGNMTLRLSNDREIHFTNPGGTLIPEILSNVTGIKTNAKYVLVVEKDTVFQKLLDEDCPNRLNCIVITGKGYPDIATRMFVKVLAERMGLVIYALVDADPHGFEIMCNYKYGSINLSRWQGSLSCPSIRWLGLRPSELRSFRKIPKIPFTDADISRYEVLLTRPYVNETFLRELKIMRSGKAQIEAINCNNSPTTYSSYIQMKIESGDYI